MKLYINFNVYVQKVATEAKGSLIVAVSCFDTNFVICNTMLVFKLFAIRALDSKYINYVEADKTHCCKF